MPITRFAIVHSDNGQVESGANYPGCSASNPSACQPLTFASLTDAQNYATQNNEQLYFVGAALPNSPQWNTLLNQVWAYVSAPQTIPPAPIISGETSTPLLIGGVLLAAYFLL